jgi:starch phosphorylase
MLREYLEKAYLPSAEAYNRRTSEGAKLAMELDRWHGRVDEAWSGLRFGELRIKNDGSSMVFEVEVYLGRMNSGDIQVQLYADPIDRSAAVKEIMQGNVANGKNRMSIYKAAIITSRPSGDFTPRIVPYHPEASIPREAIHILWFK